MYKFHTNRRGFSLVELLVVMALIGILASIVYVNFAGAGGKGRDAKRQADLKILQTAIEQYKTKYGRYPEQGCGVTPGSDFSTEASCTNYVEGLVPEFLPRIPTDPSRGTNSGFAYMTNNSGNNVGTAYKAMVINTVESETVTYKHPMSSCDSSTISPPLGSGTMCVLTASPCRESDARFQKSYAVWGGYAESAGQANLALTRAVICR